MPEIFRNCAKKPPKDLKRPSGRHCRLTWFRIFEQNVQHFSTGRQSAFRYAAQTN